MSSTVTTTFNGVTWLELRDLARQVHVSHGTVGRWAQAGAIRVLGGKGLRGRHGALRASLADAIYLRLTPAEETRAAGILRAPEQVRQATHRAYERKQTSSLRVAHQHRQGWEDFDLIVLIDGIAAGTSHRTLARRLGRTYAAVIGMTERLRQSGDLPPVEHDDLSWLAEAVALLTPTERAELGVAA